ncbi:NYN domain-containing protein [Patescibacteria group bacterium]|nr:NYN domain-containing protein [Patescibacteria group bacterium]
MQKPLKNYAFIDSQNVNLGICELGWKLDWRKFRVYLKEKYGVETAYMFIGYIEENQDLYLSLQKNGYILVFKEILKNKDGFVKGNCDAELVLQAMIDYDNYEKAVIVSGDGDFACIVRHLKKKEKLEKVLVPNMAKYSALLKKAAANEYLDYMNNLQKKLSYMKSTP